MSRKGPWEGYSLARCLLPAFLCAHIEERVWVRGRCNIYIPFLEHFKTATDIQIALNSRVSLADCLLRPANFFFSFSFYFHPSWNIHLVTLAFFLHLYTVAGLLKTPNRHCSTGQWGTRSPFFLIKLIFGVCVQLWCNRIFGGIVVDVSLNNKVWWRLLKNLRAFFYVFLVKGTPEADWIGGRKIFCLNQPEHQ